MGNTEEWRLTVSLIAQREANEKLANKQNELEGSKSLALELWDWMKSAVAALLVVMFIHHYCFNLSTVKGSSMEPTLESGEWLFVNKAITYIRSPKRGEVVILKEPDAQQAIAHPYLVKRVVAVAGDKVETTRGILYINGNQLQEPYTDTTVEDGDFGPVLVPQGQLFVMGDNRHPFGSSDSRSFGTIPISFIEGRAEWIIWPFSKATGI
jgi:signal peptidase I